MNYKIVHWNINQATDKFSNNTIPELVGKEIIERKADLVVLTEFCFCQNAITFLREYFDKNGYDYFPRAPIYQSNDKQNIVLLAWKKDYFETIGSIEEAAWHAETTKNNNVPNYAGVKLKDKQGTEFILVGVRITMASIITAGATDEELCERQFQEQATLRSKQMEYVLCSLDGFSKVIVAGDFNNYRRGTFCKDWNVNKISCGTRYKVYTPEGQSIYGERATCPEYEFAEDHFMTIGCSMKSYEYDRTFMNKYPEIYTHGNNFSVYDKHTGRDVWRIPFGSGYPDHAILIGELELENMQSYTYVCTKCGKRFESEGYSIPPYCDDCGDFN